MQIECPQMTCDVMLIASQLDHYELFYGAGDDVQLGKFIMEQIQRPSDQAREFLDPEKVGAAYGTGGNNVPLVEQEQVFCITGNAIDRKPENGGNGIGYQADLAYTLTATDHHAVFSRQRVDIFKDGEVTSTQSARQHKDATDLVLQGTDQPRLIRRLTPLECERLQGFPDGWTDIPNASDSSRYKALGNSVAIPCVDYVLFGIALVLLAG